MKSDGGIRSGTYRRLARKISVMNAQAKGEALIKTGSKESQPHFPGQRPLRRHGNNHVGSARSAPAKAAAVTGSPCARHP